jgi:hypothetical protein
LLGILTQAAEVTAVKPYLTLSVAHALVHTGRWNTRPSQNQLKTEVCAESLFIALHCSKKGKTKQKLKEPLKVV